MKQNDFWKKQFEKSAVLNPVDRTAEVLFGLIMILTFTGAISVSTDGTQEIRQLLWAALGCNVAWGIVDAIMYLMDILFERGYSLNMFRKLRKNKDVITSRKDLREEIPSLISDLMTDPEIDHLRDRFSRLPEPSTGIPLTLKDIISAFQIFLLVFICTLPVALPFGIFKEAAFALRVSNGIALLMLFIGGYRLASLAGFQKFVTAIIYMLIGVVLVSITMVLGG